MKALTYSLLLLPLLLSCAKIPAELETPLSLAGSNRSELTKVLRHYSRRETDSLKLRAACFLIRNMQWHGNDHELDFSNSGIPERIQKADTLFYTLFKKYGTDRDKISEEIRRSAAPFQEQNAKLPCTPPLVRPLAPTDLQAIGATFLIRHIDHAFRLRERSEPAGRLSFPDFCEYILPYRPLSRNSPLSEGESLYRQFGKYLLPDTACSIPVAVNNYRFYLEQMRVLLGKKPCPEFLGQYELFFAGQHECREQCELQCNVFRACGIPMAIDINIGNREFVGQHHHCVVFDTAGNPRPFHGEANYPTGKNWGYYEEVKLNIYRNLFGAQEDTPHTLAKAGEELPAGFGTPCIADVTSYIKQCCPLELPVDGSTARNRLVWLYSYARNQEGIRPVTWGTLDTVRNVAQFQHVVPGMLYFPCVLAPAGRPEFLSPPVCVKYKLQEEKAVAVPLESYFEGEQPTGVQITRKFPYKENMKILASNMVGGIFYGANRSDGSDKRPLYKIEKAPGPFLSEYRLKNRKAWKYYIYIPPPNHWYADISMLELIPADPGTYPRTDPASPLPVFSPKDTLINRKIPRKLAAGKQAGEAEYDGNMQTASGKKTLMFEADVPVVVNRIRMAPKNADNILHPDERYELMAWNDGWEPLGRTVSRYNYLAFDSLSPRRLYWLRNHSRGREEVPFIIRENRPAFLYYDFFESPDYETIEKLDTKGWICSASSEEPEGGPYEAGLARYAADGNPDTWWHSRYTPEAEGYPHGWQADLRRTVFADGFTIRPRGRDVPRRIRVELSDNGQEWLPAGEFAIEETGEEQRFIFPQTRTFRHFRVIFVDGHSTEPFTSVAEIGLILLNPCFVTVPEIAVFIR